MFASQLYGIFPFAAAQFKNDRVGIVKEAVPIPFKLELSTQQLIPAGLNNVRKRFILFKTLQFILASQGASYWLLQLERVR